MNPPIIHLVVAKAPKRSDESPEADAILERAGRAWIARQEALAEATDGLEDAS